MSQKSRCYPISAPDEWPLLREPNDWRHREGVDSDGCIAANDRGIVVWEDRGEARQIAGAVIL